ARSQHDVVAADGVQHEPHFLDEGAVDEDVNCELPRTGILARVDGHEDDRRFAGLDLFLANRRGGAAARGAEVGDVQWRVRWFMGLDWMRDGRAAGTAAEVAAQFSKKCAPRGPVCQ